MPSNLESVSTKQQRIAEVAQRSPKIAMTSLSHYIDLEWLKEAYRQTRKDGALGIDQVTHETYAKNLDENLQNLLVRLRSGTYKAPPVRRKHIPKGNGETRPIASVARWTAVAFGLAKSAFRWSAIAYKRQRPTEAGYCNGAEAPSPAWQMPDL